MVRLPRLQCLLAGFNRGATAGALLVPACVAICAGAARAASEGGGGLDDRHAQICVADKQRAAVRSTLVERARRLGTAAALSGVPPQPFKFFPQAGTLWRDIFPGNFVDLDATSGVRDWHCTDYTYDGHQGVDSDILSFPHQEIGVPVFAALDGTVAARNDGQFDQNTEWKDVAANYVVLDHGGSHYTYYWHLKNGSVAVNAGDFVAAGQQLGLTASSGISTGPHLHFEAEFGGQSYESFAGPCRSGASAWETQTPFDPSLHVRELVLTRQNLNEWEGPLFEVDREGTFLQGTGTIYVLIRVTNLPAGSNRRIRVLRPNGTVADDSGTFPFGSGSDRFYHSSFWWNARTVNFDQTGNWKIEYRINGAVITQAPLRVVASADQMVNRAPFAVTAQLDPSRPTSNDVVFCRLAEQGPVGDPDYDIVRYRYNWTVNGRVARNIVSAGRADALPHNQYGPGDTVTCRVTPGDGTIDGPQTSVSAKVSGSGLAPRQTFSIVTNGTAYQELLYNYVTGELDITPYQSTSLRVARSVPREQWTGVYHYDYATGRYSQATFSYRDGL